METIIFCFDYIDLSRYYYFFIGEILCFHIFKAYLAALISSQYLNLTAIFFCIEHKIKLLCLLYEFG